MQTLLTEGFRLGSKSKDPGANQQPTLPLLSSPVRASRTHSVDTDAGFVVVWGNVTLSEKRTLRRIPIPYERYYFMQHFVG